MLKTLSFSLFVLNLGLSAASLLLGAVSWSLLKKWRQFRHFAFLSFIVAGTSFLSWMYAWSLMDIISIEFFLTTLAILITHIQMSHCQLITTIMIYTALVEVFCSVKIKCKYVLVCLFSWLLPVAEGLTMVLVSDEFMTSWIVVSVVELSIVLTNVVLYVRVVYSLVRLLMRRKLSAREVCGKALVSTLACVTAGLPPVVGTIMVMCLADYGPVSLLDIELSILPNLINLLLANVFFLSMKSHRLLWGEYIKKLRDARAARRDLDTQLTRQPGLKSEKPQVQQQIV